ncbi:acid phosphatase [Novosphingobium soli]|uniref:Phosphatase PAP2 family protein n=1 Tax=Novosphingobium soli TaxID=574956 RepID=A0ABV6CZ22_9SPHN
MPDGQPDILATAHRPAFRRTAHERHRRGRLTMGLRGASILAVAGLAATSGAIALGPAGASAPPPTAAAAAPEMKLPPGIPQGYLAPEQRPDSLALLPPPPAPGSAAFAGDEEARAAMARLADSPRFTRAASDADLQPAHSLQTFACALGVRPDPERTPTLYRLLGKSMVDIGLSTYKAKTHYQRVRPFVAHASATCLPQQEAALRSDGSYPSGHSAVGWGWALILAELAPARADAVLQRGRDFGESRMVCNVHWASDVDAGRVIASATVARLHAEPTFRADLDKARAEMAGFAADLAPSAEACRAEAAELSMR